MNDISELKRSFREELKLKAKGIDDDYRREASYTIYASLTAVPQYMIARTVFCFVGVSPEPDTMDFLEDILKWGKRLCVPYCEGNGIMHAVEIKDVKNDLKPGRYGIPEPVNTDNVVDPFEIDAVIVPCLSCDHEGRRIGHGAGYYDRYLPKINGFKVGICLEHMVSEPETIPMEPTDCMLDAIVTEKCCYM